MSGGLVRSRGNRRELAKHAALTAHTLWAAFRQAAEAWIEEPARSLDAHLTETFEEPRALSAEAGTGS